MLKKFNVRVYGLLIENDKVLVADEIIKGKPYTKFPGGGLELGEGTATSKEEKVLEMLQNIHL